LLRQFVANQADLQDALVGAVGGRSDRTPDVAMSNSGLAAAYLNQAVLLRPISDAYDAVLDHVASFYAGSVHPMPELDGLPPNRAMGPALLGSAVRNWIGYLDGNPIAVAASHAAHGVVNLCLAATRSAARRRGAWRTLGAARPLTYQQSHSPVTTADLVSCAWASCPLPVSRFGRLSPMRTARSGHSRSLLSQQPPEL